MILGWHGERKRVVYEGEEIGLLYLVEPRIGPIRGYWRRPEGDVEALGEWPTLEDAYHALAERFADLAWEVWGGEEPEEPPF